ncbi:DUF7535 family protein [Halosegnis marinus]|uniref:DUF4342 domain-containing protein n=1 Tax=Halosegnis marinus TaxID=3034023 RepID=A0ABD5ZMS8_9EURY|nr:hypothetical protein [Halosegnis sp. DT85]
MERERNGNERSRVARVVGAVTPSYAGRDDTEMHGVGLGIGGLLLLGLLLPLLPVFVAYLLVDRAVTFLRRQAADEPEPVARGRRPA